MAIAQQPIEYDTNRNNIIDDAEFFVVVDEWLGNEITDTEFFVLLDFWIGETPLTDASPQPPESPQPPQTLCPIPTGIMTLRGGVPTGSIYEAAPEAGFSAPIDIAFSGGVALPQGSNIELNITSVMAGLEPRNGTLRSPFIASRFYNLGPLTIQANGSTRTESSVNRAFEWASFTPYWTDDLTTSGSFSIRAVVRAPGCDSVSMTGRVSLYRRATTSGISDLSMLSIQQTAHSIKFSALQGSKLQVTLFTPSGNQVYLSPFEPTWTLSAFIRGERLANGVYFYQIRIKTPHGSIEIYPLQMLPIIR